MEFFRFFERLFPHNHHTDNNKITREQSMNQCHLDFDKNSNILETEGNVTVNCNEYISNIDSSVDNIEEFSAKTLHYLENVVPIEITTNDNTFEEPMENEISLIEDIISNNATGASLLINDIEDQIDRHVIPKGNRDLEEIQIRHDTEVSNDIRNTEANTTYNNVFNDETMSIGNIFENNVNANCCEEKELVERNNEIIFNLKDNYNQIITIDSATEDEVSQKLDPKDTISINDSDETESDGYNSADFEFISETEAKMAGIVINHRIEKHQKLSQSSFEPIIFCFNEDNQGNEESDPGEGPSQQNRPINEFEDRSYRNNHHVPIGDDYLGLFQGIYNPLMPMSDILFLENKSTRASAMNIQYDGIGFDKQLAMRRHQPDSSEDEFEDEAKESAKKILKMYPGENRKKRRRYL